MTDDAADPIAAKFIARAVMYQAAICRTRAEEKEFLAGRDESIRKLRELDEKHWTYARIGERVGLKAVTVVKILRSPAPPTR